ncbi:hypothetical protein Nepgr_008000 [Nepenthes gracilis]|uniref:Uncharacterized protein n=1 Tax=Nepenthes gracilis TaxID=150966 RepID=A0AAD3S849_NEPGR|nr:hypothetical protein Nepgr_008000 [Nepenthes gracilis]
MVCPVLVLGCCFCCNVLIGWGCELRYLSHVTAAVLIGSVYVACWPAGWMVTLVAFLGFDSARGLLRSFMLWPLTYAVRVR